MFAWAALVAGLVLPTVAPEVANITTLVLMGIGLVVVVFIPRSRTVLRRPSVWLPLVAGLVLLLALLPTATSPLHVLSIFVLIPLFLVGPLTALLRQLGRSLTPTAIGAFALIGTAGAAGIAAYDVVVRGVDRGGVLVNNPIHLADLALLLGFVALAGLFGMWRGRALFLLGPVLALVTIYYSGSRGPLVAMAPMLLGGGLTLALLLLPRRLAWISMGGLVVLLALGGAVLLGTGVGGRLASISEIGTILATGTTTDGAADERLTMYASAWGAFQASPIFGHGMIDYTTAAARYAPAGSPYAPSGHLHNDIADFAVIGGVLGLVSYLLLLAAPLVGGWRGRQAWGGVTLYLGIVSSLGYLGMGLTNAMFGVLTQTVAFAVVLALIAALPQPADGDRL